MNRLQQMLKDADPVGVEPPLEDTEVQRMRRAVVALAGQPQPRAIAWRPLVLTVATAAVVIAGAVTLLRRPETPLPVPEPALVRQLQFSTPTGTRVIWIFSSEFQQ
jgi:hypothetical protein